MTNDNTTSDRYRFKRISATGNNEYVKCFLCGKKIKTYNWTYDFEQPYYIHIRGDFLTEDETQTVCYQCFKKKGQSHHKGYETSDRYLGLKRD